MPRLNVQAWRKVGASQLVKNSISEGFLLRFESTPSPYHLSNQVFTQMQHQFVDEEVTRLLEAGSIKECTRQDLVCILPVKKCFKTSEGGD